MKCLEGKQKKNSKSHFREHCSGRRYPADNTGSKSRLPTLCETPRKILKPDMVVIDAKVFVIVRGGGGNVSAHCIFKSLTYLALYYC